MDTAQRVTELKNEFAALMTDAPQILAKIRGTQFQIAPMLASSKTDGSWRNLSAPRSSLRSEVHLAGRSRPSRS